MADAFIGLDLGTTGIKAVAFDGHDRQLALATVPTPTNYVPAGGAEYRAEELWAAACSVLRGVTEQLTASGHVAAAIAVASMGESGVLVDSAGQSVAPVIAWFDARTEPQAAWWREHVGAERTQAIAALQPRPVFAAAKMLWTKAHLPDAWAAGQHWLNMADWATHRLSGVMATDHSLASRTMLFDLAARTWSDELIDAAGLDPTMLAPLIESGQRVGTVTLEAAESTGLRAGIPVGAGGQDHVCAALALDVTEPGMLLDSIGTAEAFFLVTDGVDDTDRLAVAGIAQGAHVEPGRTYAMTGLAPGGGRIDQAREDSGLDWDAFLATPEADAVIESVAVDGQAMIAELLDAAGAADVRHIATGGGSRNHRLIERKQAIGGRPITVAPETEATALGAAILARRALEAV